MEPDNSLSKKGVERQQTGQFGDPRLPAFDIFYERDHILVDNPETACYI